MNLRATETEASHWDFIRAVRISDSRAFCISVLFCIYVVTFTIAI